MTNDASAVITGCCITAQRMIHYSTSDDYSTLDGEKQCYFSSIGSILVFNNLQILKYGSVELKDSLENHCSTPTRVGHQNCDLVQYYQKISYQTYSYVKSIFKMNWFCTFFFKFRHLDSQKWDFLNSLNLLYW